jgi:hypothetical protein
MSFEPSHPSEFALHHELRDVLNHKLRNTSFYVWIDVRPTSDLSSFAEVDDIATRAEAWLDRLDPDVALTDDRLPEFSLTDPAGIVTLRAIPKKPSARGHQADSIVGNPEPVLTGWA